MVDQKSLTLCSLKAERPEGQIKMNPTFISEILISCFMNLLVLAILVPSF